MGLKKTNYNMEDLDLTLPTAYAIINRIEEERGVVIAEFNIQTSREAALTKKPIQKITVICPVNRADNPKVAAYNFAKGYQTNSEFDETTGEYIEKTVPNSIFSGWEDDLVTPEVNEDEVAE